MKCPLLGAGQLTGLDIPPKEIADCLKEKCAWWNSELEACALVSLELELASLAEILTAIGSKMPHEEQFRR